MLPEYSILFQHTFSRFPKRDTLIYGMFRLSFNFTLLRNHLLLSSTNLIFYRIASFLHLHLILYGIVCLFHLELFLANTFLESYAQHGLRPIDRHIRLFLLRLRFLMEHIKKFL